MKIVYIASSIVPSRIANSIHVMNICSCLAEMGHDVTILLPKIEGDENQAEIFSFYGLEADFKIEKLYYPSFKGKTFYYTYAIYKALKRIKPDYVIGRFVNGCAVASMMGFPITFDSHGPMWEDSKISNWFFKRMLNQETLKKLTVNSIALKDLYLKSGIFNDTRFNPDNLVVAHNGANVYDLNQKVELPGRKDSLKVGYFGHLYAGRGIELIIELARRMPDLEYYIVGGEEQDINHWKEQTSLKNLHFLGFVPFANVYKYRHSCDILLAPYQKIVSPGGTIGDQGPYMNPIKYLEYMSSCKGIVASELPSTREVLNESNAILVDCADVDQWEKAILTLACDSNLLELLSKNAYADFENNYTWKIRAERLIEGATR